MRPMPSSRDHAGWVTAAKCCPGARHRHGYGTPWGGHGHRHGYGTPWGGHGHALGWSRVRPLGGHGHPVARQGHAPGVPALPPQTFAQLQAPPLTETFSNTTPRIAWLEACSGRESGHAIRIANANQHPIRMGTKQSTSHGACGGDSATKSGPKRCPMATKLPCLGHLEPLQHRHRVSGASDVLRAHAVHDRQRRGVKPALGVPAVELRELKAHRAVFDRRVGKAEVSDVPGVPISTQWPPEARRCIEPSRCSSRSGERGWAVAEVGGENPGERESGGKEGVKSKSFHPLTHSHTHTLTHSHTHTLTHSHTHIGSFNRAEQAGVPVRADGGGQGSDRGGAGPVHTDPGGMNAAI